MTLITPTTEQLNQLRAKVPTLSPLEFDQFVDNILKVGGDGEGPLTDFEGFLADIKEEETIYRVVLGAFTWSASTQGHSYWSTIAKREGWRV